MNCFNENQLHNLFRPGGCIYKQGDLFIFCSRFFDGVFIWDSSAKKCFVIDVSNDESSFQLYLSYLRVGEILYFIPYKARYMLGYHLGTQKMERIPVRTRHSNILYHQAVYYKENIILFPDFGSEILIYNMKKRTTTYYKLKIEEKKEDICFFFNINIYHCGDKVWFVTGKPGKLYCYNLDLNSCVEVMGDDDYGSIVDITGDNNEFLFILMERGVVVAWNINSGEKRLVLKENSWSIIPYFKIHYSENRIWLIPQDDDNVRVIDLQGNEIYKWNFSNLRDVNGWLFEDSVLEEDKLIITSFYGGNIVLVDIKECRWETLHIELGVREIFNVLMNSKKSIYNNEIPNYGTRIWKEMKSDKGNSGL